MADNPGCEIEIVGFETNSQIRNHHVHSLFGQPLMSSPNPPVLEWLILALVLSSN